MKLIAVLAAFTGVCFAAAAEVSYISYFGAGSPKPDDATIRDFKINVPHATLQELQVRLKYTRIGHTQLEDVPDFEYGFNLKTLQSFRDYWINSYDWRKWEAKLNELPQYTTEIEGLKIHFIHAKPPAGKYKQVVPLLLVHGWPGNVFEFYKAIPMLTDPAAHLNGSNADIAFEVVAPSIPGFGWSDQPQKKGCDQIATARIFNTLVTERLGIQKYVAQGGDWGSIVTADIARQYPERLYGLHLNMMLLLGRDFNAPTNATTIFYSPVWSNMIDFNFLKELGYFHIQATKPDTVGVGLNDSPIGLMAYILEKFSTWTNPDYLRLSDGGLEKKFTKDELLTIIMIYWTNGNIVSSVRYYKELFMNPAVRNKVTVPTAYAAFAHDIAHPPPEVLAKEEYNLTRYTYPEDGGHFAAFEVPTLFSNDVFELAKTVVPN
ncbi:Protein W01A11.1 [Aphelenchoides avenae]|nr:Protein W01A11.1 [Aphelenchus avenae]